MNSNVLIALQDLWRVAATTHNRRVLTPWMHYTCPNSYRVYRLGDQVPTYLLNEVQPLDDGTPVYEGYLQDIESLRKGEGDVARRYANPAAFFALVSERIRSSKFEVQLSVAEHQEFLRFLRRQIPEEVLPADVLRWGWNDYAAIPFVGRTLASLTPYEAEQLPDNLSLYCLHNEQTMSLPAPKYPVGSKVTSSDADALMEKVMGGPWVAVVRKATYSANIPGSYVYETVGFWVVPGKKLRKNARPTLRQLWEEHLKAL